ncbi:MAG: hypothetical protein B6U88_01120 [Candidatus Aenigmarchaeota archaeon ex4484_56]|nr:MAG: hypothetical protein B6U88_01120 [Candidatus Aenigmarchaeota archaeon ex4484_56]
MRKGVASVIGGLLLAVITVVFVVTVYYGISSTTEETQTEGSEMLGHELEMMGTKLKIDVFGEDCNIYLRNIGTTEVPIEVIGFYIDRKPADIYPNRGLIKKDAVQEIYFLGLSAGKHKLVVKINGKTVGEGYLTCTGPSIVCFTDSDCNDGDSCTEDKCENAGTTGSYCDNTPITICRDDDGCCPSGCSAANDNDCTAIPTTSTFLCTVRTSCGSGETDVLGLSAQDNAHAEIIGGGGNYKYKLCCANVSSIQTTTGKGTCPAGFTGLITLAGDTNAQVEEYNYTGGFSYKKNVCVNLVSGSLNCIYTTYANCNSLSDWNVVVSLSEDTNAHIGNATAYSNLVLCCK